jgi:peptidyl-tRNA hydrolase ICT1
MKINKDGFLIIRSELTRYQQLNLADALEKLRNLIREIEKPKVAEMSPETIDKIRKRKEAAAMKRLVEKRNKSSTKEGRQAPKADF